MCYCNLKILLLTNLLLFCRESSKFDIMEQQEAQNVDDTSESIQESLHEKKVTVSSSDELSPLEISEEESKLKDFENTSELTLNRLMNLGISRLYNNNK